MPLACRLEGLAADHLAVAHQWHQERSVVAVVLRGLPDPDDLRLGHAVGGEAAQGVLPARDRDLVLAPLGHADDLTGFVLAGHELVDETRGGMTAAGDQLGADAVPVDRCGGQARDGELVEVGGDDDPGVSGRRAPSSWARTRCASRPRSPESIRTAPSSGPAISTPSRTASAMS